MKRPLIRMFGLGSSMLLGGLSVWLSTGFSREAPTPAKPAGLRVADNPRDDAVGRLCHCGRGRGHGDQCE